VFLPHWTTRRLIRGAVRKRSARPKTSLMSATAASLSMIAGSLGRPVRSNTGLKPAFLNRWAQHQDATLSPRTVMFIGLVSRGNNNSERSVMAQNRGDYPFVGQRDVELHLTSLSLNSSIRRSSCAQKFIDTRLSDLLCSQQSGISTHQVVTSEPSESPGYSLNIPSQFPR
jgi:hypothetical protein